MSADASVARGASQEMQLTRQRLSAEPIEGRHRWQRGGVPGSPPALPKLTFTPLCRQRLLSIQGRAAGKFEYHETFVRSFLVLPGWRADTEGSPPETPAEAFVDSGRCRTKGPQLEGLRYFARQATQHTSRESAFLERRESCYGFDLGRLEGSSRAGPEPPGDPKSVGHKQAAAKAEHMRGWTKGPEQFGQVFAIGKVGERENLAGEICGDRLGLDNLKFQYRGSPAAA